MLHERQRLAADARDLARIQRELQRLVTARGELTSADAAAAREIGCAPAGVAVYRRMYTQRLVRELAREFPATRALLGSARFDAEAAAFVFAHPSASFTLDGYGRAFPTELKRARRGPSAAAADLARLELEIARVGRSVAGAARAVRRREPALESGAPRLGAAPGARVRRFAYDVDAALAQFVRGEALPAPPRRVIRLALFRRGARVVRLRLARRETPLLAALLGGDALEHAVARAVSVGLTPSAIRSALARWVAAGALIPEA